MNDIKRMGQETKDSDQKLRRKCHAEASPNFLNRLPTNRKNVDRKILSMSTGALVLSLVFLKKIVPFSEAFFEFVRVAVQSRCGRGILE